MMQYFWDSNVKFGILSLLSAQNCLHKDRFIQKANQTFKTAILCNDYLPIDCKALIERKTAPVSDLSMPKLKNTGFSRISFCRRKLNTPVPEQIKPGTRVYHKAKAENTRD